MKSVLAKMKARPMLDESQIFRSIMYDWNDRSELLITEDGYELVIDLPGFDKSEISIDVGNQYIRIAANNNKRSFQNSYYFGSNLNLEDVTAKYKSGVLTIRIGRTSYKNERKINIE